MRFDLCFNCYYYKYSMPLYGFWYIGTCCSFVEKVISRWWLVYRVPLIGKRPSLIIIIEKVPNDFLSARHLVIYLVRFYQLVPVACGDDHQIFQPVAHNWTGLLCAAFNVPEFFYKYCTHGSKHSSSAREQHFARNCVHISKSRMATKILVSFFFFLSVNLKTTENANFRIFVSTFRCYRFALSCVSPWLPRAR